jgi:acyl-coenzyme A thioesterase PaaI-like protein
MFARMDDGPGTLVAVASAARELNRLVRITRADDATLDDARRLIEEACGLLGTTIDEGPHVQSGTSPTDSAMGGLGGLANLAQPAQFFPYSPVVGPLNAISPPVDLEIREDGSVGGSVTLTEPFNGPPWDLAHGGVVALIFDELLGLAGIAGAGGGFTGRLTVRYHKPTPIRRPLALEARVTEVRGRKIKAHGSIHADGVLTAEADGLFISAQGPLSAPPEERA